jgi:hypothetical protein
MKVMRATDLPVSEQGAGRGGRNSIGDAQVDVCGRQWATVLVWVIRQPAGSAGKSRVGCRRTPLHGYLMGSWSALQLLCKRKE